MKVVEAGHVYQLDHVAAPGHETLTFIRRSSAAIVHPFDHAGTNTQEVLRALIDRSVFLNNVIPCSETEDAIEYLRMALACYEARAMRRKRQKLNGHAPQHEEGRERYDDVPFVSGHIDPWWSTGIETLPVDPRDGHVKGHDDVDSLEQGLRSRETHR